MLGLLPSKPKLSVFILKLMCRTSNCIYVCVNIVCYHELNSPFFLPLAAAQKPIIHIEPHNFHYCNLLPCFLMTINGEQRGQWMTGHLRMAVVQLPIVQTCLFTHYSESGCKRSAVGTGDSLVIKPSALEADHSPSSALLGVFPVLQLDGFMTLCIST
jgi:hypothetical protein